MDLVIATWALVLATILIALITLGVTWRGWKEARRLAEEDRQAAERLAALERKEGQKQYYANWQRSETLRGLAQLVVAVGIMKDAEAGLFAQIQLTTRWPKGARATYADDLQQEIARIQGASKDISNAKAVLALVAEPEIESVVSNVDVQGTALFNQAFIYRVRVTRLTVADPLPPLDGLERARKAFDDAIEGLTREWYERNLSAADQGLST